MNPATYVTLMSHNPKILFSQENCPGDGTTCQREREREGRRERLTLAKAPFAHM